jgi:hypothetical protein
LKCRFFGGHARRAEDGTVSSVEDEEKKKATLAANTELNFVSPTTLKLLRSKKVDPLSFIRIRSMICKKANTVPVASF